MARPLLTFNIKFVLVKVWPKTQQYPQNKIFEPTKREKQKHKQISETLKENITTIILQNDTQ